MGEREKKQIYERGRYTDRSTKVRKTDKREKGKDRSMRVRTRDRQIDIKRVREIMDGHQES